jgi:hypothetical protein
MLVKDGRETVGCVMSEKDPAFDFKGPDAREILPDVAEAIQHFGFLKPFAAFDLAAMLAELWNDNPERMLLRKHPELIAELTEKGFEVGPGCVEVIIRRAINRWYLARDYALRRRDLASKFFFPAVEIGVRAPRVCCAAALALDGVLFKTAQSLPTLPLAACDFEFCGCDYRSLTHSELERRED